MAKIGSEKKPIIARVQTQERWEYVAKKCKENGLHYIIGLEPDKPEDISNLDRALSQPIQLKSNKVGRNDSCPCGSGKKYKKCCAS
ncbi:MAG: SEC-C domain-containing protein [Desulfobacterales bacterium]|nr:SEC-C domain-containing protein [Desulfobacterales bacterium]